MVHRCIKPSNILVFNRPPPYSGLIYKFSDLGISQAQGGPDGRTTSYTHAETGLYYSEALNITLRDRDLT